MSERLNPFIYQLPLVASFFGQLIILIVMISQHQWLYMAFVVPSLISTLCSFIPILLEAHNQSKSKNSQSSEFAQDGLDVPNSAENDVFEESLIHPNTTGNVLPSCSLLSTLLPQRKNEDAHVVPQNTALWRACVYSWLTHEASIDALCTEIGTTAYMHTKYTAYNLDLIQQGPHALVAGTTGSGKSIFLENWCLGLAWKYSPTQINFIFLDFKGGATFQRLHSLPHTIGFASDLDVTIVSRALRGIETELSRREYAMAQAGVSDYTKLPDDLRFPRLIIVIDEFHALTNLLPDYMDRLIRLASLGRSLGMHLVVCTQNPLGQVNSHMKANISLHICLRVRDSLQSQELIGTKYASMISPQTPGLAYIEDGDSLSLVRSYSCTETESKTLVKAILRTHEFINSDSKYESSSKDNAKNEICSIPQQLFSPSLPKNLSVSHLHHIMHNTADISLNSTDENSLLIGLYDTGIVCLPWFLHLDGSNIAIIGAHSQGKTTLLHAIRQRLTEETSQRVLLIDDADDYLDPLKIPFTDPSATCKTTAYEAVSSNDFYTALSDSSITVIYCVSNPRNVRFPDNCTIRLIFPTGEKTTDTMWGIPNSIDNAICKEAATIPGRLIIVDSDAHLAHVVEPSIE